MLVGFINIRLAVKGNREKFYAHISVSYVEGSKHEDGRISIAQRN